MSLAENLRGLAEPRFLDQAWANHGTDWTTPDAARKARREAAAASWRHRQAQALAEIAEARRASSARPVTGNESRGAIRDLAERRVDLALEELAEVIDGIRRGKEAAAAAARDGRGVRGGMADGGSGGPSEGPEGNRTAVGLPVGLSGADPATGEGHDAAALLDRLNSFVEPLNGRPFRLSCSGSTYELYEQLHQFYKRATCPVWWKAQLKRAATRTYEAGEVRAGRVSRRARTAYASNETVRRRGLDNASNATMLERTELEAADGTVIKLSQAVEASPSNKSIRRGELMTRLRGCEDLADDAGMVGLFTTNTAPSRFHSVGGANPKYDGSTPRDSQDWLCKTWAACRSKLKRAGVRFFGFRVAEPHHDGCAHWHMLLWCEPEQAATLRAVMHKWWRLDEGTEEGAAKRRCLIKTMDKGGAAGYVAKYVAKNIDDAGAVGDEGHDEGGTAARVEAWASAWGIRQFQAFGQPPITVWRELRRVEAQAVQGASPAMRAAHEAVNREGERKACYRAYLAAQGGAMNGRGYRLRLQTEEVSREGRYGLVQDKQTVGVADAQRPGEYVPSSRKAWKPRGTWTDPARDEARRGAMGFVRDWLFARPKAAQPWTRVINCTQGPRPHELAGLGLVGLNRLKTEPGGSTERKPPPCPLSRPSNRLSSPKPPPSSAVSSRSPRA